MCGRFVRHRRRVLPAVVALIFLVVIVPGSVFADCPVNTVYCSGLDCCPGGVIFHEHETSTGPANVVSYGSSSASYNLVTGMLTADAYVVEAWEHQSGATAVDVFTMNGVPAATVKIRLGLTFATVTDPSGRMAWTTGYAKLEALGQSVEANSYGPHIDPNIEIEIDVTEGQPFTVIYETVAAGWGYFPTASMTAQLYFIDLPEGANITSCNGYGDTLVPVENATWGLIKSLYQ